MLSESKIKRRSILAGLATASIALIQTSLGKVWAQVADDPTKKFGIPPSEVGSKSSFEK